MEQLLPRDELDTDFLKSEFLVLYEQALARRTYPGYPQQRYYSDSHTVNIPVGLWETTLYDLPEDDEVDEFLQIGLGVDNLGRPLHPWYSDMLTNPNIGVLVGKGMYWNWGPNYTADPIIIRHDLQSPHLLLITRSDTGDLALPGGFVDPGEHPLTTAIREASEEALIDLRAAHCTAVYNGPTADIRTTANAWPHTFAYRFDLPDEQALRLPVSPYKAGDDAAMAQWVDIHSVSKQLFGAHRLLIKQAFEQC